MISSDQPICFPKALIVGVSSKNDGTMLDRTKEFHSDAVLNARKTFCQNAGLDYVQCVYQLITYEPDDSFCQITEVKQNDTVRFRKEVHGDAFFTREAGVGLFLPVADCVATVMYDPKRKFLALLHLGRHATYANLSTCAIQYFTERGSDPKDLIVWMSPHAGPDSYALDWFDRENDSSWDGYYTKRDGKYYLDLAGYNAQQFIRSGVLQEHITVSPVDTVTNDNYFSHTTGDVGGRIAVVAMMR